MRGEEGDVDTILWESGRGSERVSVCVKGCGGDGDGSVACFFPFFTSFFPFSVSLLYFSHFSFSFLGFVSIFG